MDPNPKTSSSGSSGSSYINNNPIDPKEGEVFSRAELPTRFRYKPIKDSEIDNVNQGGAELVF
ncbi:uncharacterized protein PRCAT00002968001 [Priceomyces carsonii]|uniref:uncharacterized protein n=1 Tax=Priceomyces carsonii TaxID=28549 RepID=UPI002EDA51BC|nr:unnamed protein product [Priceomyces carsonii]